MLHRQTCEPSANANCVARGSDQLVAHGNRLERIALASSLGRFFELTAKACSEGSPDAGSHGAWLEVLKLSRPIPQCTHSLGRLVRERVNQATWIDKMLLDY